MSLEWWWWWHGQQMRLFNARVIARINIFVRIRNSEYNKYLAKCVNIKCGWLNILHLIEWLDLPLICKWSKNPIDNYYVFKFKIHILMMMEKKKEMKWKRLYERMFVVHDKMTACQWECAPNRRHLIIFPFPSLAINFSSRFSRLNCQSFRFNKIKQLQMIEKYAMKANAFLMLMWWHHHRIIKLIIIEMILFRFEHIQRHKFIPQM